ILFREGGAPQPGGGPGGRGGPGQVALVEGLDPSKDLVIFGGGTVFLETGRSLNADDTNASVALVGVSYGETQGVGLGGDVMVNGTSFTVVGLFTSGTVFGDNAILIPFEMAKSALDLAGPHLLYVEVDTVGNVDATVVDLGDSLGAEFDIVPLSTTQGAFLQSALDSISASSQLGASISLGLGLAVMVFTMVLVTRERVREMGLFKALGFGNGKIVSQFLLESLMLAGLGFLVGLVVAVVGGPTLAALLARQASPAGGLGGSFLAVQFALDPTVVVFALLVTALMGVVGSLYPVVKALRMSPAEALRDE
ncbi:MAG: ABC transporter permease, partial [Thermoplasmata archaeon]